ncbi:MAG TPA: bifunctional nicotinamidase/pyrazinamidase [Coriobacteriia bacterium]|nr:bifunctional nicotinamidase/pyrazinamidase [Coriobacteriia bacterium]
MRALVLVDIQNDFMPFGGLPVHDGDAVVEIANRLMPHFDLVIATQDWHPANHGSFASNHPGALPGEVVELGGVQQVLWPDHCVQNTPGASFHSALDVARIDAVVHKGTESDIDSYSTFFDNGHRKDTGLAQLLRELGATQLWMAGLATDYCVKFSALDGLELGFEVMVVAEGVRAVDLALGDGQRALEEIEEAGGLVVSVADVGN